MNIKAMFAAILLVSSSNVSALGKNLPHPYDYAMHAMGGYIIADVMEDRGFSKLQILAAVAGVAIAKEASDKNFDWNDAAAWMPGPIIHFTIKF